MKKLPFFLLLAFILGGCRTAHSVSQSFLSSIDSMMTDNPDTAYKVLKDISPDELNTRRERAYYALLLTQARHKNYIPLRNDSLINVAASGAACNFTFPTVIPYRQGITFSIL